MVWRLSFSLALFLGSLTLGWWLHRRGAMPEARASRIVRFLVKGPSPLVLCLLFWRMDLSHLEPWLLPFLGTVISASTLLPAALYARRARLPGSQTGSFLACAFFSNVGYLGAFTAFALYGEAAYGLCMLYLVFFTPCFYTLGFWIGARYGRAKAPSAMARAFNDELRIYPFAGMLAGIVLNLVDISRPQPLEWLNHVLIPLDTALYLTAIGSQLRLDSPRPHLAPCLMMSGIKFLYTPLVAWLLVTACGLQGLPRFVVLLEASTPVAVSPMVLPLLFGLDRRLANALWLFTTVASLPWLLLVIPFLQRL